MAEIDLAHLLDIDPDKLHEYKFHSAVWNGRKRPLDDFIKDGEIAGEGEESAWWWWQAWREDGQKNRWTRKYILSFMRVYPEGKNVWLFGGIFEVKGIREDSLYDVRLTDKGKEYIGRLKVIFPEPKRQKYLLLENVYPNLKFSEILKARYSGVTFPGYKNISLDFPALESIVNTSRDDWRTALSLIKGIYVISDKETGKKYVGSAYGAGGVWSRWSCYVYSFHGGNKELKELLEDDNLPEIFQKADYVRENFRFTLAEWISDKDTVDNAYIIARENFWKEALLSRKFGYNAN